PWSACERCRWLSYTAATSAASAANVWSSSATRMSRVRGPRTIATQPMHAPAPLPARASVGPGSPWRSVQLHQRLGAVLLDLASLTRHSRSRCRTRRRTWNAPERPVGCRARSVEQEVGRVVAVEVAGDLPVVVTEVRVPGRFLLEPGAGRRPERVGRSVEVPPEDVIEEFRIPVEVERNREVVTVDHEWRDAVQALGRVGDAVGSATGSVPQDVGSRIGVVPADDRDRPGTR